MAACYSIEPEVSRITWSLKFMIDDDTVRLATKPFFSTRGCGVVDLNWRSAASINNATGNGLQLIESEFGVGHGSVCEV